MLNPDWNNVQNSHSNVSETAVIGIPHEIKGESPVAYCILKSDDLSAKNQMDAVRAELIQLVRSRLAKFAAPHQIIFVNGLPKAGDENCNKSLNEKFERNIKSR